MTRPLICPAHAEAVDAEHFRECLDFDYAMAKEIEEDSHPWPSVTALLASPRQSAILHFFPELPVNPHYFFAAERGTAIHRYMEKHDEPQKRWHGEINGLALSGIPDRCEPAIDTIIDYKYSPPYPWTGAPRDSHRVQVGLYNELMRQNGEKGYGKGVIVYEGGKTRLATTPFDVPTLDECLAYEVWEGQTVGDNVEVFKALVELKENAAICTRLLDFAGAPATARPAIQEIRRLTGGDTCPCDLIKFGKATMAEKYCAVVDMCKGREF